MKRHSSRLLIAAGIFLVLAGIIAAAVFQIRIHLGVQHSQMVVSKMYEILPQQAVDTPGMYPASGMPVLDVQGTDYVAMIEIPAFGITLPVADRWDSSLSLSPARFTGSAYSGDLVIGGADYPGQFGFCGEIEHGVTVIVTDMTGVQFAYTVSRVDRATEAQAKWLMGGNCDLTLFCHDAYAMEYIAVRCVLSSR